jgi:hypothetical protein
MKRVALLLTFALVAGCASHERRVVSVTQDKWASEALAFERADVRAEVETRFRKGDLRFKGWVKSAADTVVLFPGVTEEEAGSLRQVSLAVGEVLFVGDLLPFFVGDMAAWEQRTAALFDYMQRFNRTLFEKLAHEGRIPNRPNKALEPTTTAVTIRAPSSTARASRGRGSS